MASGVSTASPVPQGTAPATTATTPTTGTTPAVTNPPARNDGLGTFFLNPARSPLGFTLTGLLGGLLVGGATGAMLERSSVSLGWSAGKGALVGAVAGAALFGTAGLIASWTASNSESTPRRHPYPYNPGPPVIYDPYPVPYNPYPAPYYPYPDPGYGYPDPGYGYPDPGYGYPDPGYPDPGYSGPYNGTSPGDDW